MFKIVKFYKIIKIWLYLAMSFIFVYFLKRIIIQNYSKKFINILLNVWLFLQKCV